MFYATHPSQNTSLKKAKKGDQNT